MFRVISTKRLIMKTKQRLQVITNATSTRGEGGTFPTLGRVDFGLDHKRFVSDTLLDGLAGRSDIGGVYAATNDDFSVVHKRQTKRV